MADDTEIKLAAFVRRAGQWGLQLFGDELEKTNGNMEAALEKARERFNRNPSPPSSLFLEALAVANKVKTAEELGIELPKEAEEVMPEQQQQRAKPKPHKVKPSPFERS